MKSVFRFPGVLNFYVKYDPRVVSAFVISLFCFVFSMSLHFSFPSLLLHPSHSFPLRFTCWGKTGYLFCSISHSLDICDYILVVFTGVCWEFGYVLLFFSFCFEFHLVFFFFFWYWSRELSWIFFWRTEPVPCVTCGSQTCCVSWRGLKYFQINCHQLSIVKFPIKVKASVFLLCLQSEDPGILGFCGDAHRVVTRGDITLQRAPSAPGDPRLH